MRRLNTMTATMSLVATLAAAASPACAGDFSPQAQQVWIARSQSLIAAIRSNADTLTYLDGIQESCKGLVGELMSNRVPNWAGIQQQSVCAGVGELAKGVRAKRAGRGYCGSLQQSLTAARKTPQTEELKAVYAVSQLLGDADEALMATSFNFEQNKNFAFETSKPVSCK